MSPNGDTLDDETGGFEENGSRYRAFLGGSYMFPVDNVSLFSAVSCSGKSIVLRARGKYFRVDLPPQFSVTDLGAGAGRWGINIYISE